MNNQEYIKESIKRESVNFDNIKSVLSDIPNIRLLHGSMGLCTEAGEIMDTMKKTIFYGKPLDKANLIEELGDVFWYLALITDELGVSFEEIQQLNVDKLTKRYGNAFNETKALNRNIDNELRSINNKFGNPDKKD